MHPIGFKCIYGAGWAPTAVTPEQGLICNSWLSVELALDELTVILSDRRANTKCNSMGSYKDLTRCWVQLVVGQIQFAPMISKISLQGFWEQTEKSWTGKCHVECIEKITLSLRDLVCMLCKASSQSVRSKEDTSFWLLNCRTDPCLWLHETASFSKPVLALEQ